MQPLVVENLVKRFGPGDHPVVALDGVDLTVERGDFVSIMGASGSGKSTLLHLAAGLSRGDSGRVLVAGSDLGEMDDRTLTLFRRKHIGLIFQSFNLIPTLTAAENIALPLRLAGVSRNGVMDRAHQMLARLGLTGRGDHRPDALSGGEQQRVAIGRALITEPTLILADEPTGNLDVAAGESVCRLLRELCESHDATILMVTHEPSVASWAQRGVFIADGRIVDRFDADTVDSAAALAERYQTMLTTR